MQEQEVNAVDIPKGEAGRDAVSVPCFLSGTLVMTEDGLMPIDWVGVGDRVMTADHGLQTVRWRGHREFRYAPEMPAPIEIAAGALGPDTPRDVLRVAPQHRIAMGGAECELHFAEAEVFVAAEHLLGLPGVTAIAPDLDHAYHQLLFDRHEVLISDGVQIESLFLGEALDFLLPALPDGLIRSMADGHAQTARMALDAVEAVILAPPPVPRRHAAQRVPAKRSAA